MKASQLFFRIGAACVLLPAAWAQAATVTGTVTDKTTNRPAAGDAVAVVDVQASMSEVAHATTDSRGRYSVELPGSGPYLIRVTHQGAGYFIAAPQGGGPGDIPVYDVAAHVNGVSIEADVYEFEADQNQLRVTERYFVHNTSSPPRTQWTPHTFEVFLPSDATVAGVAAQRPTGLPTSVKLDPTGTKGHYAFNFPIQPDEGEKDTLFQIEYTLPYAEGKYTFHPEVAMPTQSVGVLLPKSMSFTAATPDFQPIQQDPSIQTFVARNLTPGKSLAFTVSGIGSVAREAQSAGPQSDSTATPGSAPGGGIGEPINTPDPLSKYKWWILGGLALLLAAAAAFFLRKPPLAGEVASLPHPQGANPHPATVATPSFAAQTSVLPVAKNAALLNALKEELFALESEKISGMITAEEYGEVKPALEIVLGRALKRKT